MRKVKLKEILTESKIPSKTPNPDRRITVKLNVGGVEKRPLMKESGTTKYYIRKAGQFIYGRQNLFKGAFGIVPEKLDGYESSIDLPAFDVSNECIPEWIVYFLKVGELYKNLEIFSKGSGSKRIHPKDFLELSIPLPSIKEQKSILEKIYEIENNYKNALAEFQIQTDLIAKLRSSILSNAVSGRLVPQNPADEPASVLLERIKAEKEKLIKEGKIKKQKPLPPISEDEIPYELPQGWVWCRLGEFGVFERGKSKHRPRNDPKLFRDGIYPFVQTGDVSNAKFTNYKIKTHAKAYNDIGLAQSRLWPKNTLCITIAANIAEVGYLDFDACFPDSVVAFTSLTGDITTKYLFYFLLLSKEQIAEFAPSTAQKNINLNIINTLYFPLPPLTEQNRIVSKVEKLMATCDALEAEMQRNRGETHQLMQSVLKEAFT